MLTKKQRYLKSYQDEGYEQIYRYKSQKSGKYTYGFKRLIPAASLHTTLSLRGLEDTPHLVVDYGDVIDVVVYGETVKAQRVYIEE